MSAKKGEFDQPQSLMCKTMELVKQGDLIQISFNTGIPFYWLRKFAAGTYLNPSCNRVQYLYEHLTNTKLI